MSEKLGNTSQQMFGESFAAHNPLIVLNKNQQGELDAETTIDLLECGGRPGKLHAAEMRLERSFVPSSAEERLDLLERSRVGFGQVVMDLYRAEHTMDALSMRAFMHYSQFDNLEYIALMGALPPYKMAYKTYDYSVHVAHELVTQYDRHAYQPITPKQRGEEIGVLSEFSVLLLGQRYALRSIGDQSWFPILSHHSENHRNRRNDTVNHAWDIDVLTDMGNGIDTTYRIQVKTSKNPYKHSEDETGISRVTVQDDLSVSYAELKTFLAATILDECYQELVYGSNPATRNLDRRSEFLLDALDR